MSKEEDLRREAERLAAESNLFASADMSPVAEGLSAMHELYLSLEPAGFNSFERLWIISYIIAGGNIPREAPPE